MRQSGRVSLLTILAIFGVAVIVTVLMFSKEGPGSAAARFMDALAKGDVDRLTAISVIGNKTPDQIKADWEFATTKPGKYYNFAWKVTSYRQINDDRGTATAMVQRNIMSGSSYDEKFDLDLRLVDGKWKVDVAAINPDMYPGVPRADR